MQWYRYAHVNVTCLENSPANLWFSAFIAQGGHPQNLIAHIDERTDYDGLAVAWGINNKKRKLAFLIKSKILKIWGHFGHACCIVTTLREQM
jgi:hypothetical protein